MPYVGELFSLTVSVFCPRDQYKVYKMPIDLEWIPDGRWLPRKCNGCEYACGDPICLRCRHDLTILFFDHPDWRPLEAIYPLRPKDQQPC